MTAKRARRIAEARPLPGAFQGRPSEEVRMVTPRMGIAASAAFSWGVMGMTTVLRPRLFPVCQTIDFSRTAVQGSLIWSPLRRPVAAARLIAQAASGSACARIS